MDTSYHPSHKFTMSRVVVRFTWRSLGELCAALMADAGRFNSLLEPSWPDTEKVREEMFNLVDTLMIHGVDHITEPEKVGIKLEWHSVDF